MHKLSETLYWIWMVDQTATLILKSDPYYIFSSIIT